MINADSATFTQMERQAGLHMPLPGNKLTITAQAKFRQAQRPARIGRLWSALTRRPCRLLRLADVQASYRVRGSHYAGTRPVPIRHIRGSEGRCEDFDADFRPLQTHNKRRWVSVAKARLKGVTLPPVELIQIGDVYFVRDGHHRISVARAFGQEAIDAEVTVWEVADQLSQKQPAPIARLAAQPA